MRHMGRRRINTAAICSSENYESSKRAHRTMLENNHKNNQAILMAIGDVVITPKSDLELWEEGLKAAIAKYKQSKIKSK